jgi:hypothetical protein
VHLACFSVITFIGYAHSVKCGRLIHERSIGASRQKIAYCHQGMREIDLSFNKVRVSVMVFNTTFKNISAISLWSVLLVKETGVHGENHRQTLSHNVVWSI